MNVPEIDARSLRAELDGPNPPRVLDVREDDELEMARLPDELVHIPFGELPGRVSELNPNDRWVVVCRVGGRSGRAVAYLQGLGFAHVRNLTGGMNGYAQDVDPSLPQT